MAFVKYKNRYIKLRDNFCYLENTLYFKSFSKLTEFLNEYQRRQQENPHYKLEEFDRWLDYMGIESNNVLSKKIPQTENAVN